MEWTRIKVQMEWYLSRLSPLPDRRDNFVSVVQDPNWNLSLAHVSTHTLSTRSCLIRLRWRSKQVHGLIWLGRHLRPAITPRSLEEKLRTWNGAILRLLAWTLCMSNQWIILILQANFTRSKWLVDNIMYTLDYFLVPLWLTIDFLNDSVDFECSEVTRERSHYQVPREGSIMMIFYQMSTQGFQVQVVLLHAHQQACMQLSHECEHDTSSPLSCVSHFVYTAQNLHCNQMYVQSEYSH